VKKKWTITGAFMAMIALPPLFATTNAPMQRIDVINLLWNGAGGTKGISQSAVTVSFENNSPTPCFTSTLAFQGSMTVWVGVGQHCVTPVTSITITPIARSDIGLVYDTPATINISNSLYSAQILVSQNIAPVFDPFNGAILSTGTLQGTVVQTLG